MSSGILRVVRSCCVLEGAEWEAEPEAVPVERYTAEKSRQKEREKKKEKKKNKVKDNKAYIKLKVHYCKHSFNLRCQGVMYQVPPHKGEEPETRLYFQKKEKNT